MNPKDRSGKRSRDQRTFQTMKQVAQNVARSVVMRNMETKHASLGSENLPIFHNSQISVTNTNPISIQSMFDVWRNIVPGTMVTNRVGTEIFPRGMSVRLYIENVGDRPNVHYRVIVGVAPKQLSNGTATAFNNLEFLDQGSPGNLIRHSANDLGYKFLYDRVFSNELGVTNTGTIQGVTGGEIRRCHKFIKIWIRRKPGSKIVYNSSATGVVANLVNKPLFMAVIGYDSQNSLPTDQVGVLNFQTKLYWKDA